MLIVVLAPIVATAHICRVHKLRPLLAGLAPTRERGVTRGEGFKVQAART
jgi:hypothetical protein